MADRSSPEDIIQNILIQLRTVLDEKSAASATSAIKKQTKEISRLTKASDSAYRGMYRVGSVLRKTVLSSLGAVAGAAGALIASINDTGKAFNQLEMSSADAGRAMKHLRSVYQDLQKQNKNTLLSIQDLSAVYADFRKNISRRAFDDSGLAALSNILAKGVGLDTANQKVQELFDSLEGYRHIQKSVLKDLKDFAGGNIDDPNKIRTLMKNLQASSPTIESDEAILPILQMMQTRVAEIEGTLDPAAASARKLTDAVQSLGQVWDTLKLTIVDTFGPTFAKYAEEWSQWLKVEIPKYIKKVSDRFNEWGGVEKILEYIRAAWEKVSGWLKTAWEWAVKIKDEFMSLPGWLQKATLAATAFVAVFGVRNTASIIWNMAGGIAKITANLITGKSAAIKFVKAIGSGSLGMGAANLLGGGIAGLGGHTAGKAGARALGAEQYGSAEAASGIVGAGLAGAAVGGPIVGAITAAASAMQSLSDAIKENLRVAGLLDDALKDNENSANKFSAIIQQGPKDNSEFAKGLHKRMELTRELMSLENKRDAAHGGLFGFLANDDEINKQIDEVRKKIAAAAGEHGSKPETKGEVVLKKITTEVKKTTNSVKNLKSEAALARAEFEQTKKIIEALGPTIDRYGELMTEFGADGFGLAEDNARVGRESLEQAGLAFEKSKSMRNEAAKLRAMVASGVGANGKILNEDEKNKARVRAINLEAEAAEQMATGQRAQQQGAKSLVAVNEANLARVRKIKDVVQEEMRMSEAIYGTSALAVQKRLELVRAMDLERQQLQEEMKVFEEQRDAATTQEMSYYWENKRLEAAKDLRSIQAEQLEQLKELRDGYLDAVQAQAFGAGKFQKIIIDQDMNIAKGLDKNIAKKNFLLGTTGAAAGASNKQAYRFSSGGIGMLQDMQGNNMGADAIAKQNEEAIKNISDPMERQMAQDSQRALGGVFSGFTDVSQANTQALDRLTETLQSKFMATGGTGALQGNAGTVALGDAARRAMGGKNPGSVITPAGLDTNTRGQLMRDRANRKAPGKPSMSGGWSVAMKGVIEVFKKLGPLLDEWMAEEGTKQSRPTRSNVRTSLGGPGS